MHKDASGCISIGSAETKNRRGIPERVFVFAPRERHIDGTTWLTPGDCGGGDMGSIALRVVALVSISYKEM
jgi:hypothetical protein